MSLSAEKCDEKMVAEKGFPLEPVATRETSERTGDIYNEDQAFGNLHRSFTPRQIHVSCSPWVKISLLTATYTDHLPRFKRG